MKNKWLKVISVILAIVSVFSFNSIAYGDNETDTPETDIIIEEYTTIGSTGTGITISGVKATCTGRLTAQYSTSLKIKLELQKKGSSGYSTVQTWTGSKTSTSMILSGSKTINPLSKYRVKATYTAGSETTTIYAYP